MIWLGLALAASLIWAASNLIDSKLISNRSLSPLALCLITGLFGFLPAIFFALFGKLSFPDPWIILVTVGFGILFLFTYYPYYRALETTHAASAVLLWNLSPILVACLAFVFLNEKLAPSDYLAIFLIVMSAMLISLPKQKNGRSLRSIGWMALASIMTAIGVIIQKWLFMNAQTDYVLFSTYFFGAISALILFIVLKRARQEIFASFRSNTGPLASFNELLNIGGGLASGLAISLGPVSLVKAAEAMQPLFVLGLEGLILLVAPKFLKSMPEKPKTWAAITSIILAIIGLTLLKG